MFYDNLKKICDEKGLKLTPLVTECGGAKGSISNWKKGSFPNSDIVINLAVRLNVSTDYLLTGKTSNSSEPELSIPEKELLKYFRLLSEHERIKLIGRAELLAEQSEETPNMIKIKHSIYKVSAGKGYPIEEGDAWQDEIQVPDTPQNRKADLCITIKGNSMEPLFKDGDIVLVKSQKTIEPGQIGIFNIGGEGFIKKFGGDRLISLNEEYDDIIFSEHEYDRIECEGIVLGRI